ncbi:MAG: ATP-binding protein [Nocardiopsaceae bacterium]|nr:ATP-binding protein [Nocardiopsaceae bacterium]
MQTAQRTLALAVTGQADVPGGPAGGPPGPLAGGSPDPRADGSPGPRLGRSDALELGALPGAVPSARLHARLILSEWRLDQLAADVELVVSELTSNAVTATRAAGLDAPVRLTLLADSASVLVVVWDAAPGQPVLRPIDAEDESGRGLTIVASLSAWWDCKPAPPGHGGKLVRAYLREEERCA